MIKISLVIRPETKKDYDAITEINNLAFKRETEGKLVQNLRQNPNFVPELSLIAEKDNRIIGHILFYPIKINEDNLKHDSLALAPMSVHPDYQNKGVGSKLVQEGLKRAQKLGYKSVIVLGHPDYYPRFGFKPASNWNIRAPFEVPNKAFLALELKKDGLKDITGTVEYPKEYIDV